MSPNCWSNQLKNMNEAKMNLLEVISMKIQAISEDLTKIRKWVQNSLEAPVVMSDNSERSKLDQINKDHKFLQHELILIKILNDLQIQLNEFMENKKVADDVLVADDNKLKIEVNPASNPFKNDNLMFLNGDINSIIHANPQEMYNKYCKTVILLNTSNQRNLLPIEELKQFQKEEKKVWKGALTELDLPQIGSTIFVLVTSAATIFDPCHFYVQLLEATSNAIVNEVCGLIDEINKDQVEEKYEKYGESPQDGEVVLVFHWSGKWLRAQFIRLESNGELRFFMVDFGEEFVTKIENIRRINAKFLQLPFQAIECWLHNYQMSLKIKKSVAANFFRNFIMMKPFQAIVHGRKNGGLVLEIRDFTGYDIGVKLVQYEFVEHCKIADKAE